MAFDWGTLIVAIVTAIVTASVTAWVNNRYQRGHLVEIWRQERSQARLDSLKQHMHRYVEGIYLAVSVLQAAPIATEEPLKTQLSAIHMEALAEAIRALGSAASLVKAIGDGQLQDATKNFGDLHIKLLEGKAEEAAADLIEAAGAVLRRCEELAEERSKGTGCWQRILGR